MSKVEIRTVDVTRYVQPLREGGSLPAIVEADDGFSYVIKFRGAGQGKKALVAELIGGEMARALELQVPELVFMNLDDSFGRTEPDEEIQDLLKFSVGLNLGLHYLAGSITYDPSVSQADPWESSRVVLLDSILTNVDRTYKNTNLLNWNRQLWLIDHGASLYFHHSWDNWKEMAERKFPRIKDHVLLHRASEFDHAKGLFEKNITEDVLMGILESIPDEWLMEEGRDISPDEARKVYFQFIKTRLSMIDTLIKEADDAREARF
ncbi:MAG: aminotransferase class I and II [Bacteroidia bacterium]|nr:aminotransferase class I and II [Bacteroidia bacterium]